LKIIAYLGLLYTNREKNFLIILIETYKTVRISRKWKSTKSAVSYDWHTYVYLN